MPKGSASLADLLELVLPALSTDLVPTDSRARLSDLARGLPGVGRAGFEVRLGPDGDIDFQQGFVAGRGDFYALHGHLERTHDPSPSWERVAALLARCNDETSSLHGKLDQLWLEFDRPPVSALSLFVGFERDAGNGHRLAHDVLEALGGRSEWDQALAALDRCFHCCPEDARVSHLGVMLGRSVPFLRLNVRRLATSQMPGFLRSIGWPGRVDEAVRLTDRLRVLADGVTVCLDVGETVAERLGLECHLEQQPPEEPGWKALLDELAAQGWCLPDKRDALLEWAGRVAPPDAPTSWPAHLVHAELRRSADHFTSLERRISHVKVTYGPGGDVTAKGYLEFVHSWLRPRLPSHLPVWHPTRPRRPGLVSASMRSGLEFLLESRTSSGWWRDFSGSIDPTPDWPASYGWSDEWVTAFVASILAGLVDPQARDAARRAWSLLVERSEPVAAWGANRNSAPDADSTAWVLRLAAALGVAETRPARDAHRFLLEHEQPDGGLTTYVPSRCPRPPAPTLQPPGGTFEGWSRTSHSCVTAAAAPVAGERQRDFLRNAQRSDGAWDAYWWDDDEYATALAAEALVDSADTDDERRVDAAIEWARRRLTRHTGEDGSAFAIAWCVRLLRLRANDDGSESDLGRGIRWLLDHQEPDGGWAASARMILPRPDITRPWAEGGPAVRTVDDGRVFTTATVLSALAGLPDGWG